MTNQQQTEIITQYAQRFIDNCFTPVDADAAHALFQDLTPRVLNGHVSLAEAIRQVHGLDGEFNANPDTLASFDACFRQLLMRLLGLEIR